MSGLQRHTPLLAKTPLARTTPMPRGQALKRSDLPRQRSSWTGRTRPRYTGPAKDVRDLIHTRDGQCVVGILCRDQPWRPLVIQHRVGRGMGGTSNPAVNRPSALHLACDLDNGWLEDHPTEAYEAGWKVRRGGDPSTIPIRFPDGTLWLLDDHGGRTEVTS